MGRPKGWASDVTGRPVMRSPGRPPVGRREHRVRFWAAIARGLSSEDAAVEAGVSAAVGVRWFRESGGVPSVTPAPLSGAYLSFVQREEIALLRARGCGVREIARELGRSPSTVSRKLRRNAATRGGGLEYRASRRAVACRASRSASAAREARGQRRVPPLCAGSPVGCRSAARRERRGGSGRAVDRPSSWASEGPAVGALVEPCADLQSAAPGLPR